MVSSVGSLSPVVFSCLLSINWIERNGADGIPLTSGMSAAGVTVRLEPMARQRSALLACSKLQSNVPELREYGVRCTVSRNLSIG